MTFSDYQRAAMSTAIYPNRGSNLAYPTLGLCGESGEVAEKVKKYYRDGTSADELGEQVAKELGDVLWYITAIAWELGWTLDDIAEMNIQKLASRKERGVQHGSGDDR